MKLALQKSAILALCSLAIATHQTCAPATAPAQKSDPASALHQGFANPPQAARLRCYWWWLNGYTTEETITRELHAMKQKGYAGVLLVDDAASQSTKEMPLGPNYGSPAWMALYLHALQVADQLGLEISLEITNGGNVGILGGPGVGPEDAIKLLTYSRTPVHGGDTLDLKLPPPPMEGGFYRQIAVLAYPLRHGAALPGTPNSGRKEILALPAKIASREVGVFSMPDADKVFLEAPSVAGEQDADASDVIDLTTHSDAAGTLHWSFPAGDWEVLRIGYTASSEKVTNPAGTGYAVDALRAQAFDHYWDRVITPILAASKPYLGKSLRYLVTDSWETGGANWTEDFRQEFLKRRGYDPVVYLPVVSGRIIDSRVDSNQFLEDLRRTVADLITENYYDHFADRAATYGLGTHPESGGPHGAPIDALETFRKSAFAQTEFWAASPIHRTADSDRFFVKEASSASHIYGKQYVAAESFSTINMPWSNSPGRNLKPTFDRALTEGLNRVIWHEFTSSPENFGKPGIEYFADTHLDPNVTWWNQAGPMLMAINRAQFLLQQGRPVADLLYYYGTQVPDFVRMKVDDPASVLPGYDYDVTDQDALLHRMIASGGKLRTPEGIEYRALALPVSRAVAMPDLEWIDKYVRGGGVVIGLKPLAPLGRIPPGELIAFQRLASAIWGDCAETLHDGMVHYGEGRIYCTRNAHRVFGEMSLTPDFEYKSDSSAAAFDYVHRTTPHAEIYFVRNQNDAPAKVTLSFRVHGLTPELWHIDTGETTPAPAYQDNGTQTTIPLDFPAFGSVFVLFEHPSSPHPLSISRDGQQLFPSMMQGMGLYGRGSSLFAAQAGAYTVKLSDGTQRNLELSAPPPPTLGTQWTLNFPPAWGAPPSISISTLQSWTDSAIPGVRYFSGTATYGNTLNVSAALLATHDEIWMNLGDVREVATVAINGKELRTLWHAPFLVRIDPALHAGQNQISIRVSNLWPNRLIGDLQPSEKIHYTHTNIHAYTKDSPLLPSGLLSPVTITVMGEAKIQ